MFLFSGWGMLVKVGMSWVVFGCDELYTSHTLMSIKVDFGSLHTGDTSS